MRTSCTRLATHSTRHALPKHVNSTPYSWRNPVPIQDGEGSKGPLSGKGIALKDNISYAEAPTTCSSAILEDYTPPYNATCVTSLLSAGASIVGKTKMDEFGMGSTTTHLPRGYSSVHNPSGPAGDEEPRSAGGSSGGSAAAVAEGSAWAALGTDTGGSVRLPASYCGVVGLKPSYGLVSRYGVVSYADSLDCVGVLASNVSDVEAVFGVVSHPDDNDMTCVSDAARLRAAAIADAYVPVASSSSKPLQGVRIGLPIQTHLEPPNIQLDPQLLEYLREAGASLHAVDMPSLRMALPAYYVLASAEAASNLGRYGGGWYGSAWERSTGAGRVGDDPQAESESGAARRRRLRTALFGDEVRKRLLAGTYALTADAFNNSYLKALHLRRLVRREFDATFRIPSPLADALAQGDEGGIDLAAAPAGGVDILLHPTAVRTAPKLYEESTSSTPSNSASSSAPEPESSDLLDPAQPPTGSAEYLQDVLTVPASLAGLPAMSVPAGRGGDGWPVGVSVVGQWGCEGVVFRAAKAVEGWGR